MTRADYLVARLWPLLYLSLCLHHHPVSADKSVNLNAIVFPENPALVQLFSTWSSEFTALHPNVRVSLIAQSASATDALNYMISEYLQDGAPVIADVLMSDVVWQGTLAPYLVDLRTAGSGLNDTELQRYQASAIANNLVDDKLVALPWYEEYGRLYYRSDLLKKYNRSIPHTWAELSDTAEAVIAGELASNPQSTLQGFAFQGYAFEGLTCNVLEWLASSGGGTIVEADPVTGEAIVTVNNPQALAAFSRARGWVGTLSPPSMVSAQELDNANSFFAGDMVFMRSWGFELDRGVGSAVAGKFGVTYLPSDGSAQNQRIGTTGGAQLSISSRSTQQYWAMEFIKFLSTNENQELLAARGHFTPSVQQQYLNTSNYCNSTGGPTLCDTPDIQLVDRPSRLCGAQYPAVSQLVFNSVHNMLTAANDLASQQAALQQLSCDIAVTIQAPTPAGCPPVYYAGDLLSVTQNATTGILAFFIATLGGWVSLLLIEQALYDTKHRGDKPWHFIMSLSSSAGAFALCGVWSSSIINVTQPQIANGVHMMFEAAIVCPALLPVFACIFVSYLLMLTHTDRALAKTTNAFRGNSATRTESLNTSINNSETSQKSTMQTIEMPVSIDEEPIKVALRGQIVIWTQQAIEVVSPRSMLASLSILAAQISCQALLVASIHVQATMQLSVSLLVTAAVLGWLLDVVALHMFFHLFKWRAIGSFVMGGAQVLVQQLLLQSITYRYVATAASAADGWSTSVLTLVGAGVAAIVAFVLLSLQFSRLKLSRASMYVTLAEMQKKGRRTEVTLAQERQRNATLEDTVEEQTTMLDLLHYCRPLHRPAALAPALYQQADPQQPIFTARVAEILADSGLESVTVGKSSEFSVLPLPGSLLVNHRQSSSTNKLLQLEQLLQRLRDADPTLLPQVDTASDLLSLMLNHHVCLEFLKDAASTEYCVENVLFCAEVRRFRDSPVKELMASAIASDFIVADAPYAININGQQRKAILQKVHSNQVNGSVFDAAYQEVFRLVLTNTMPKFMQSKNFPVALYVLKKMTMRSAGSSRQSQQQQRGSIKETPQMSTRQVSTFSVAG